MAELFSVRDRLVDIFPAGLDSTSSRVPSGSIKCKPITPDQLFRTLTRTYVPEHHVQSILVKSVSYGKRKKGVRHEFILIEVEDPIVGLTNHIVLDRNNGNHSPNDARQKVLSSNQSCRGTALDVFQVSYNGDVNQLLQECQLPHCQWPERLDFCSTGSEPLFLYELVTLVHGISQRSTEYVLGGENCYWFAGLIWECLLTLRPHAGYDNSSPRRRGRIPGTTVLYIPDKGEVEKRCRVFEEEIAVVNRQLRESWEESRRLKELTTELEELREFKKRWEESEARKEEAWRGEKEEKGCQTSESEGAAGFGWSPCEHLSLVNRSTTDLTSRFVTTYVHNNPQSSEPKASPMDPDREANPRWGWWYIAG